MPVAPLAYSAVSRAVPIEAVACSAVSMRALPIDPPVAYSMGLMRVLPGPMARSMGPMRALSIDPPVAYSMGLMRALPIEPPVACSMGSMRVLPLGPVAYSTESMPPAAQPDFADLSAEGPTAHPRYP